MHDANTPDGADPRWHARPADAVQAALASAPDGLSGAEVEARRAAHASGRTTCRSRAAVVR